MWKQFAYIRKGLSHEKRGTECQDRVLIRETDEWLVAALADGLGSLQHSAVAAQAATEAVCTFWTEGKIQKDISSEKQFKQYLMDVVVRAIGERGAELGITRTDMDCTLAFVAVNKKEDSAIVGLLGDSAVLVMQEGTDSLALNGGGHSANGTNAVLDRNAEEYLSLHMFSDLEKKGILGFILTSDGLDGELYMKGSPYANQAAERYFNAVSTADSAKQAEQVIADRIGELIAYPETLFDDDISLAILGRTERKIMLPADPTWLCVCGERNSLRNTYCWKCDRDFTVLYQHVRFRDYGGTTAFFKKVNQDPEEERKVLKESPGKVENELDFPGRLEEPKPAPKPEQRFKRELEQEPVPKLEWTPVPEPEGKPEQSAIPSQKEIDGPELPSFLEVRRNAAKKSFTPEADVSEKLQRERLPKERRPFGGNWRFLLFCILGVIFGIMCGVTAANLFSGQKIRTLDARITALQTENRAISRSLEETESVLNSMIEAPENYFELGDGTVYWGTCVENRPNGRGILLEDDTFYVGTFRDGEKNGVFAVLAPDADEPRVEQYERGVLIVKDAQLPADTGGETPEEPKTNPEEIHYETARNINLREEPGKDKQLICVLPVGTEVHPFADECVVDGTEWMRIKTNENLEGWLLKSAIREK